MKDFTASYYFSFFLLILCSCNLSLTKCEAVQEWRIDKYKIVKLNCLGYAGPRYYPIDIYVDKATKARSGFQVDSCTFNYQVDNESFLILNVCTQVIQELKPKKVLLDIRTIDSISILSGALGKTKLLRLTQINELVKDWNNSKTRGYSDKPFDSAFSDYPAYQYKLTVFSGENRRSFYAYNYVILDSSNWKFEMSKTGELKYFHNYWQK